MTPISTGVTGYSGHPPSGRALGRCIDVAHDVFAEKYWGRGPLLSRGRPSDAFSDLFGPAAVDDLISSRGLRTPFLRMARGGEVTAGRRFTRSGGAGATINDQVADDKVLGLLADGQTLVLQALHRTWPPLMKFGTALAAELGHPIQINAYVTPPQSQGFSAHYDTHDVFVLQIFGRKHWRVHEPVLTDPLPEQKWEQRRAEVEARAAEAPQLDTELVPGDSLYLPRGYLHSARAQGELSIHLTIGVHPLTRTALLRRLVDIAALDEAFRPSLPMGVDLADPRVLGAHLEETARALSEFARDLGGEAVDQVAASVAAGLASDTRPEPIGPLAQGSAAASLTLSSPMAARSGLRYSLTTDATGCTLRVLDKVLTLPAAAMAALPVVLDGAPFTPGDLPGLEDEQRLALVRGLLRDGVVVPGRPAQAPDSYRSGS